jgi:hypothetical protein
MTIAISFMAVALLGQGLDARGLRHTSPLAEYLRLSLTVDRDSYYPGEPIHLQLNIKNASQVPVVAYLSPDPAIATTKVYCRYPGASGFIELGGLLDTRVHGSLTRRTLGPGETHSHVRTRTELTP